MTFKLGDYNYKSFKSNKSTSLFKRNFQLHFLKANLKVKIALNSCFQSVLCKNSLFINLGNNKLIVKALSKALDLWLKLYSCFCYSACYHPLINSIPNKLNNNSLGAPTKNNSSLVFTSQAFFCVFTLGLAHIAAFVFVFAPTLAIAHIAILAFILFQISILTKISKGS